jgi:hypothetical protein
MKGVVGGVVFALALAGCGSARHAPAARSSPPPRLPSSEALAQRALAGLSCRSNCVRVTAHTVSPAWRTGDCAAIVRDLKPLADDPVARQLLSRLAAEGSAGCSVFAIGRR